MKKLTLIILFVFLHLIVSAQIQNPVKWSCAAKKINAKEAILYIKAEIENSWHIYSAYQQEGGPEKTVFKFISGKDFTLIGKVAEPKPIKKFEEVFDLDILYFEKSVVFQQKIKLNMPNPIVKGSVSFMACTDAECLPKEEVPFSIPVK